MFSTIVKSAKPLATRRFFSVYSPQKNLISDLYIKEIKSFKPQAISFDPSSVHAFAVPAQPKIPSLEIDSSALNDYDLSEVETSSAPVAGQAPVEEDWFVLEEIEDVHH